MAFWPQTLAQGKNPPGIEEVRARYGALFARFGAAPAAMDFSPGQLGPIHGEWVGAVGNGPGRTLLYFHGGGFVAGAPETHRPLVGKLVEASGVGAFSVKYRLAPECFFPAAVRDGIDSRVRDDPQNRVPCAIRHLRAAIDHSRHGRGRDAGEIRHLPDREPVAAAVF